MMTPAERAARHLETVLHNHDFEGLRDLLTPGFADHSAPPGTPPGPDGYVQVRTRGAQRQRVRVPGHWPAIRHVHDALVPRRR
jgi:hypothetical protein